MSHRSSRAAAAVALLALCAASAAQAQNYPPQGPRAAVPPSTTSAPRGNWVPVQGYAGNVPVVTWQWYSEWPGAAPVAAQYNAYRPAAYEPMMVPMAYAYAQPQPYVSYTRVPVVRYVMQPVVSYEQQPVLQYR